MTHVFNILFSGAHAASVQHCLPKSGWFGIAGQMETNSSPGFSKSSGIIYTAALICMCLTPGLTTFSPYRSLNCERHIARLLALAF